MGFLHHKQKLIQNGSQAHVQMHMVNYTTSRKKKPGENICECGLGKDLLDMILYLEG